MESESLWLGPMRKPVRLIMLAFVGVTALIYAWLVFNKIFVTDAIGMHEMIRPAEGGPIVGPILAAISTALGAVQQAKIRSAKTSFADGVIGLQGPGTETSDSISAQLSKGESVITAKATKVYAPVLAQMEQSVGNRPNFQLGQRRFARGVIAAGNLPAISAGRSAAADLRDLQRVMQDMKIFVSLTELNQRQREFDQARSFARITE